MSRKERWLTTAAIIASIIPLLFMANMLKILPVELPLVDIGIPGSEPEFVSKYNNLIMGLFCLVPLSIIIIARHLKRKLIFYRNYSAIICVSMALSLSFSGVVLYSFIVRIDAVLFSDVDVFSFIAVVLSLFIAATGPVIRYRKFGTKVAINNKYTRVSPAVWRAVHSMTAYAQTVAFVVLSIILSFLTGYKTLIIFVIAVIIFCAWIIYYSHLVKNIFNKRQATAIIPQHKKEE